jgi:hypothetical protein
MMVLCELGRCSAARSGSTTPAANAYSMLSCWGVLSPAAARLHCALIAVEKVVLTSDPAECPHVHNCISD